MLAGAPEVVEATAVPAPTSGVDFPTVEATGAQVVVVDVLLESFLTVAPDYSDRVVPSLSNLWSTIQFGCASESFAM